jgi:hypothetical protein
MREIEREIDDSPLFCVLGQVYRRVDGALLAQ